MAEETGVGARYREVLAQVARAVGRAGRDPASVRLLAVTKTVTVDRLREAYAAGARLFGENYVQEAQRKIDSLPRDAEWHMIGHLQSNKAKRAPELFSCVQSLDRPSLAEALERAAAGRGQRLEVLLQVNTGDEETKSGTTAEGAVDLARRAGEWPSLRVRGLMALPPYFDDPEEARPHFRALRELSQRIAGLGIPGVGMDVLSMGMSHDFTAAVEEGATLVRVGTAIFGERPARPGAAGRKEEP
ncbi:MAG: YggS family pyridoxal phosphate-dependent enzyme [Deferrisomatales bacterium]